MKNIGLLSILVVLLASCGGLRSSRADMAYYRQPEGDLAKTYATYAVQGSGEGAGVHTAVIEQLKLNGLKRVTAEKADVVITIEAKPVAVSRSTHKPSAQETPDGEPIPKRCGFEADFSQQGRISARVKQQQQPLYNKGFKLQCSLRYGEFPWGKGGTPIGGSHELGPHGSTKPYKTAAALKAAVQANWSHFEREAYKKLNQQLRQHYQRFAEKHSAGNDVTTVRYYQDGRQPLFDKIKSALTSKNKKDNLKQIDKLKAVVAADYRNKSGEGPKHYELRTQAAIHFNLGILYMSVAEYALAEQELQKANTMHSSMKDDVRSALKTLKQIRP